MRSLRAILGEERYDSLIMEGGAMPDDAITADIQAVLNAAATPERRLTSGVHLRAVASGEHDPE